MDLELTREWMEEKKIDTRPSLHGRAKVVKNRIVYNPSTSHHLASVKTELHLDDFNYAEEELYQTRSGKLFLVAAGHGLTPYSYWKYGGSSEGNCIIPLTRDEAIEWCESRQQYTTLEEHFSSDLEDASRSGEASLLFRLPESLKQQVHAAAQKEEMSVNTWLMRTVEARLISE